MKKLSAWFQSLSEKTQNLSKFVSAVVVLGGFVWGVCSWGIGQVMTHVDSRIDEIAAQLETNDFESKRSLRRLELLNLIHHQPHNVVEIEKVARDYFGNLGGDWYASNIYSDWAKEYGGDIAILIGE